MFKVIQVWLLTKTAKKLMEHGRFMTLLTYLKRF